MWIIHLCEAEPQPSRYRAEIFALCSDQICSFQPPHISGWWGEHTAPPGEETATRSVSVMASVSEKHLSPCLWRLRCLLWTEEGSLATAEEERGQQTTLSAPHWCWEAVIPLHSQGFAWATEAASWLVDLQGGWQWGGGGGVLQQTETRRTKCLQLLEQQVSWHTNWLIWASKMLNSPAGASS